MIANRRFSQHVLAEISTEIERARELEDQRPSGAAEYDREKHLSLVLDIVTTYLYAGKTSDACAYYNTAYRFGNKETVKTDLLKRLRASPIYRAIHGGAWYLLAVPADGPSRKTQPLSRWVFVEAFETREACEADQRASIQALSKCLQDYAGMDVVHSILCKLNLEEMRSSVCLSADGQRLTK